MRKLISAALAAITLLGAGAAAVPAMADPTPYGADRRVDDRRGEYHDQGRQGDHYDNRYNGRRDYRWDGRSRRGNGWMTHVRRCERAYRSYNRRTDTYRTLTGHSRRCRL